MSKLRLIPSIDHLLQRVAVQALERRYGRAAVLDALRIETAALRDRLSDATDTPVPEIHSSETAASLVETAAAGQLAVLFTPSLRPVINATGVIIHTNLGRAPLAASAIRRVAEIAAGYANLEYDLDAGRRGARDRHAEPLLTRLTGAEAAVVVNNTAAAALLILTALAQGREVVVSRGELVEIGGGFRVPDVMTQSGAVLREVGTTNKTRVADFAAAVGNRTALILRVHPSNFRIEGFTERPTLPALVEVSRQLRVPLVEDLGSGNFLDSLPDEPTVASSISAGADLVCFSGDKLLGGPQAGIIVGRRDLVDQLRRHPLMRALRVDKMTYAALEATLLEYAQGRAAETVPVARALAVTPEAIRARAASLAGRIAAAGRLRADIVDGQSTSGGGSAPGIPIPTVLLALVHEGESPDRLEERLRRRDPPVIARIEDDHVVLDLRTVPPEQDTLLGDLLDAL